VSLYASHSTRSARCRNLGSFRRSKVIKERLNQEIICINDKHETSRKTLQKITWRLYFQKPCVCILIFVKSETLLVVRPPLRWTERNQRQVQPFGSPDQLQDSYEERYISHSQDFLISLRFVVVLHIFEGNELSDSIRQYSLKDYTKSQTFTWRRSIAPCAS
jgi:hypothetical protein